MNIDLNLNLSNDRYRGPTELVQHFAYKGSSHRCKSTDIYWNWYGLAISLAIPLGRGLFYLFLWFLPDIAALEGGGVSTLWKHYAADSRWLPTGILQSIVICRTVLDPVKLKPWTVVALVITILPCTFILTNAQWKKEVWPGRFHNWELTPIFFPSVAGDTAINQRHQRFLHVKNRILHSFSCVFLGSQYSIDLYPIRR